MDTNSMTKVMDLLYGMQTRRQGEKTKQDIQDIVDILKPLHERSLAREEARKKGLKYASGDCDAVRITKIIAHDVNNLLYIFKSAEEDLQYLHREQNDLLHAIEFLESSNEYTLEEFVLMLSKNRKDRRVVKDFIELATPLVEVLEKYKNLPSELGRANTKMQEVLKKMESRSYKVKELTALQTAFDSANDKVAQGV